MPRFAQRRLDQFYESCDATVLPVDSVTSREVLERYFNQEPPFAATGDKKQEFPDAYALMSVEKWAEENDFKVLVVSHDKGWKESAPNPWPPRKFTHPRICSSPVALHCSAAHSRVPLKREASKSENGPNPLN
jgi:hypothetical protein